jgi:hypothetical protein
MSARMYTPTPAEIETNLRDGVRRLGAMLDQVRPEEPGASGRCERLAGQLDGLRLQAMRLSTAIRDRAAIGRGFVQ